MNKFATPFIYSYHNETDTKIPVPLLRGPIPAGVTVRHISAPFPLEFYERNKSERLIVGKIELIPARPISQGNVILKIDFTDGLPPAQGSAEIATSERQRIRFICTKMPLKGDEEYWINIEPKQAYCVLIYPMCEAGQKEEKLFGAPRMVSVSPVCHATYGERYDDQQFDNY